MNALLLHKHLGIHKKIEINEFSHYRQAQYILQMSRVEMELAESPQVFRDFSGMA